MNSKASQNQESKRPEKIIRPDVKHVIAVMSGKGGVGKSSITALLAADASKHGYKVGILDADITGPSIPKMFGLKVSDGAKGLAPTQSKLGIKIMSLNLLLMHEDDPVIWRGPLIGNTVSQFWREVEWGELDYLFIDQLFEKLLESHQMKTQTGGM